MKSKKKHLTSSDDSEQTDDGEKSSSSSESDSEDSSASEHRYKKKRKRADSSDSDSGSDYQKRSKKRKNKKKKKKHGKKKRRSEDVGVTNDDVSSGSDGEISSKKKHKNKHKDSKRSYGSSGSEIEEVRVERRILSVVKEKRHLTEDPIQTSRTYYQKEYHLSSPQEGFDRTHEVQRFYRGSSKERKQQYNEQYYERDRNERYQLYQPPKYDKYNDRYGHNIQYNDSHEDINRRPQEFDEYKRQQRYNIEHRPQEEYRTRRPRDDNYQHREENRGYRPNHYENRGPRRRDFEDNREYRERAGPSESEHYRDRDYQDKKEKFHEERFSNDRNRDMGRRDRPGPGSRPGPGPGPRPGPGPGRLNKPPHQDRSEDARPGPRGPGPRSERPPPPRDDKPRERKSRFTDGENKEYAWGKVEVKKEGANPTDKEKPNFGLSGKLTEDQNTVNGVVIKYTEPDDAKQPKRRWRFYPFKGDKALPILYIHRQSAFLIGRDKKVVDIALEHPSVSKQHAALQYRATAFTRDDGSQGRRVRPYIVDLESANGTFVNNKKIEPRRYVELLERDVVKFGFSQREYVLLHENSKDDAQDDDNEPAPTNQPVTTTQQVKQEKRARQEVAEDGE